MKSIGVPAKAGQHNLKGKKTKRLSCGCCSLQNLKDNYFKKLSNKEASMHQSQLTFSAE